MSRVSQRGISLIERMVTFARLALLLGLAAPSFSEWLRNAHGLSLIEVLVVLVLYSIGLIGMVGLRGGDLVLVYQDRANCMVQELAPGFSGGADQLLAFGGVCADSVIDGFGLVDIGAAEPAWVVPLGSSVNIGGCCNNNSALMAGIAHDSNTQDIRPDDPSKPQTLGKQTIQTYWLDVLEYGVYKNNNQFYLAAKYGGFRVPHVFDAYGRTTDIPEDLWTTTTDLTPGGQKRPLNCCTAAQPDQMIAGLTRAFEDIAAALKAHTVSFDPTTGTPGLTLEWNFSTRLAAQIAEDSGAGWNTRRHIVTRILTTPATGGVGPAGSAVPLRHASLSTAQKTALDTLYRTGDDSADNLNDLRGDRTHEENSTATGSARMYRNRSNPVGDIVGSRVRPVGPPAAGAARPRHPPRGLDPDRGTRIRVGRAPRLRRFEAAGVRPRRRRGPAGRRGSCCAPSRPPRRG